MSAQSGIAVIVTWWYWRLSGVGRCVLGSFGCRCHMILLVVGCRSLGLVLSRASLWLSHDIGGCRVSVIGLWAQSAIAVVVTWYWRLSGVGHWALGSVGHRCDCHMILEVVGCRSLGFGICRVLLSAAVVGCRLSALACRAQVVDCRVVCCGWLLVVWCRLVGVGCWLSVYVTDLF